MSSVITVSVVAIGSSDYACALNLHEHWRFASLHFIATRSRVARFVLWRWRRPISSHQHMPKYFFVTDAIWSWGRRFSRPQRHAMQH